MYYDYRSILLVIFSKATIFKKYILKICQKPILIMPMLKFFRVIAYEYVHSNGNKGY